MSNVAYVKVFLSWVDETRKLKDAEKGRLIDAMVAYAMGDTDIDSRLMGNEAYVFPIFQARLDRDMADWVVACVTDNRIATVAGFEQEIRVFLLRHRIKFRINL